MNREMLSDNPSRTGAARLEPVSSEELAHVTGGGLWSWIKDAAGWVKDHVFVDFANRVFGYKGTF